jgi:hypothetical protein
MEKMKMKSINQEYLANFSFVSYILQLELESKRNPQKDKIARKQKRNMKKMVRTAETNEIFQTLLKTFPTNPTIL